MRLNELLASILLVVSSGVISAFGSSINASDSKLILSSPKVMEVSFFKSDYGKWKIGEFKVWNNKSKQWDASYTSAHGEFLYLAAKPDFNKMIEKQCLFADKYEKIETKEINGIKFTGSTDLDGAGLVWSSCYFFDKKDKMPMLHNEITFNVDRSISPGYSPKVVTRTIGSDPSVNCEMSHIMSYQASEKSNMIDRGYPLIWLNTKIGNTTRNALLIDEVEMDSPAGRLFVYNRSAEAPFFAYWYIGAQKRNPSESFAKYYWNYREPSNGEYPEETDLIAGKEYRISCKMVFDINKTNLQFYKENWDKAFDYVCPLDKVDFWAKNWADCAKGQINEFKDNDKNAGDRYVDGVGYYSAPVKDKMSHGTANVCWHGTAEIIHGMLYYTWATGDDVNFDFYRKRLSNANFPKWAENTAGNKGLINDFWTPEAGYIHWCSMWTLQDFGAYNLYNCYKLTGDKTYWKLFKGIIDYTRDHLVKDRNTLGEHWNDADEDWYYLTPESSFTKAQKVEKGGDPGDYPGSLSVYAYLCLLTYNETKDNTYKQNAFKYLDHINTFLKKPQEFWTLCRVPKSNGFAFAALANVKRYELTKDKKYLDFAEEWTYLLLTQYHLKSEGGNEIGLAHASALGIFDYVCVSSLETIEPMYLMANILKHRVNPAFLRYIALADRRHLIAYPKNHLDKKFDYPYIPMELIPQRDSFAMYMAGAIMIENVMLHALHTSSDDAVTVICLDAAESGINLKKSRSIIAYNSSSVEKTSVIRFTGFDNGVYRISVDKITPVSMSSDDLMRDGVDISLKAHKWARIKISPM
ncbi:MAG: hypothetical protein ACYC0V_05490 [Armatimonadota bacterium]